MVAALWCPGSVCYLVLGSGAGTRAPALSPLVDLRFPIQAQFCFANSLDVEAWKPPLGFISSPSPASDEQWGNLQVDRALRISKDRTGISRGCGA